MRDYRVDLRLMAAAKLYEIGHLSQERAAELAGQCRQDFSRFHIPLGCQPVPRG